MHHTVQAVTVGELDARALANIAHGAARSVRDKWLCKLFAALARPAEAQRHMGDFTPQELANPAWTSVTVTTAGGASLFAALATASQRCMGNFAPQELANTAWAFAKADQKNASLFASVATAA